MRILSAVEMTVKERVEGLMAAETPKVTQETLAARMGKSQSWVSRSLGGDVALSTETLKSYARAFSLDLEDLLAGVDLPEDVRLMLRAS